MEATKKIDEVFRQADFAADNPDLEKRLWEKIKDKTSQQDSEEERELTSEELSIISAAGTNYDRMKNIEALLKILG